MPGVSNITAVVGVRLPVDMVRKIEDNSKRSGLSVSEYLRRIIMRQIGRKR